MKNIITAILVGSLALVGCASPGTGSAATTAQVPTQGAQTVGGDQGQAATAETGSATSQINPLIVNALAARKVTIRMEGGEVQNVTVDGAEDSEVEIAGGKWGLQEFGNETQQSSEVKGGGGAAGGTGGQSSSRATSENAPLPDVPGQ